MLLGEGESLYGDEDWSEWAELFGSTMKKGKLGEFRVSSTADLLSGALLGQDAPTGDDAEDQNRGTGHPGPSYVEYLVSEGEVAQIERANKEELRQLCNYILRPVGELCNEDWEGTVLKADPSQSDELPARVIEDIQEQRTPRWRLKPNVTIPLSLLAPL
jgi:hypothetical protein